MRGRASRWWYALLGLPLLGLLYPPLYAREDPAIAGLPFFSRSSRAGGGPSRVRQTSRTIATATP